MTGTPPEITWDTPVRQLTAAEMLPRGLIKANKNRKGETRAYGSWEVEL